MTMLPSPGVPVREKDWIRSTRLLVVDTTAELLLLLLPIPEPKGADVGPEGKGAVSRYWGGWKARYPPAAPRSAGKLPALCCDDGLPKPSTSPSLAPAVVTMIGNWPSMKLLDWESRRSAAKKLPPDMIMDAMLSPKWTSDD